MPEHVLKPIVDRVVEHGDFFEWWAKDGSPQGSKKFHGAAGVLGQAIDMLHHAKVTNGKRNAAHDAKVFD